MANLSTKIETHLGKSVNFMTEVVLQDDGSGPYIKQWNLSDKQPTESELNAAETAANAKEALRAVQYNRAASYP